MIIEVKVPSVGESVTSGVVSAWHKKSGEFVNEGEPLFALETDKVSTDIVAEKSGVLETKVPEGQEVKIGEVVAVIDDSKQTSKQDKEEKPKKKEPEAKKKEPESQKKPEAAALASVDGGRRPESTTQATTLSPGVRRIVEEEKLEPEKITGTGQGGRLTKADVLKAVENRGKAEPSEVAVAKAEEKIERSRSSANLRRVRRSLGEGGSSLHSQKDVAAASEDRAATGDGAAHRGDSHHIQRMRHEHGAGIAPEQAR